jgi:hypothetical protein
MGHQVQLQGAESAGAGAAELTLPGSRLVVCNLSSKQVVTRQPPTSLTALTKQVVRIGCLPTHPSFA